MSRSKWKGIYCSIKKYSNYQNNKIKIWSRNSSIPSFLINKNVYVYNGKLFKKVLITKEKLGYKFGEFVFTRVNKNKLIKNNKKYGSKK